MIETVSIRIKANVYSSFRALPNKPAMAISEFVDNAIASYEKNKEILNSESDYRLRIDITLTTDSIVVADNAAGIAESDYVRAFEPANIPKDNKGLNEFGMGLKTAAIWLADEWSVKSKALGEDFERTISFNLDEVLESEKEELIVENQKKDKSLHYTIITLSDLSENYKPYSGGYAKISQHLGSIYRKFIRSGELILYVNDEPVQAPNYVVLNTPFVDNPKGEAKDWLYPINFDGGKYKAKGFIGLLKRMKTGENGLVILRRGRAIMGGTDERFFHKSIFGSPGSPEYKRVYGELEIEGFDVNFNKSQITQSRDLEWLLEEIGKEIKQQPENILVQARKYRLKTETEFSDIVNHASKTLGKEDKEILKTVVEEQAIEETGAIVPEEKPKDEQLVRGIDSLAFSINNRECILSTELHQDPSDLNLFKLLKPSDNKFVCCINLAHPYLQSELFLKNNGNRFLTHSIILIRNLALAEIRSGERINEPGVVRHEFNKIMQSYENED
ncbi:MAG: ATP-binding protein [Bacteroidales bacterium]|uniref:ATP-binding protein n=1 Tax=Porphyromonas sp. TaxID=1924944 RepID=UPI002979DD69|nr:ATP-binding protein [Porphyromonas sp.]MDD7438197.1 ATP-binding protein [Bacteroidales bacterium]MDY3066844.1 ATP-binding protein [Porphyromonas sp.]